MELTNRRFGRLTVLARARRAGDRFYWRVRCSCGAEKEVRGDSLTSGAIRSCGCLWRSVMAARGVHHRRAERFGRLRIVRQVGTVKKRGRVYLCRCDCGKKLRVQRRHLRSGESKSRGCWYKATRTTANMRPRALPLVTWHTGPIQGGRKRQSDRTG
jgi:hypothetical protein